MIKMGKDKTFYTTCPCCYSDIEYTLDELDLYYNVGQKVGEFTCLCCKETVEADFKEID